MQRICKKSYGSSGYGMDPAGMLYLTRLRCSKWHMKWLLFYPERPAPGMQTTTCFGGMKLCLTHMET
jgi:hypothetical protein